MPRAPSAACALGCQPYDHRTDCRSVVTNVRAEVGAATRALSFPSSSGAALRWRERESEAAHGTLDAGTGAWGAQRADLECRGASAARIHRPGPTKARTIYEADLISCVLRDTLTQGERTLSSMAAVS